MKSRGSYSISPVLRINKNVSEHNYRYPISVSSFSIKIDCALAPSFQTSLSFCNSSTSSDALIRFIGSNSYAKYINTPIDEVIFVDWYDLGSIGFTPALTASLIGLYIDLKGDMLPCVNN